MNHLKYLSHLCRRRTFCISLKHSLKKESANKKTLVPQKSVDSKINLQKLPFKAKVDDVDASTIALLERLSLVDCANTTGIKTLEAAIEFAGQILKVDTINIQPLMTVLEDRPLQVREDKVTEGNCKEDILKNASIIEEDYFIAPPGNVPFVETRKNLLYEEKSKDL